MASCPDTDDDIAATSGQTIKFCVELTNSPFSIRFPIKRSNLVFIYHQTKFTKKD